MSINQEKKLTYTIQKNFNNRKTISKLKKCFLVYNYCILLYRAHHNERTLNDSTCTYLTLYHLTLLYILMQNIYFIRPCMHSKFHIDFIQYIESKKFLITCNIKIILLQCTVIS